MINITNENNSVVFQIDDSQVLSFPMNELSVLTEEVSDIVMFKTAKNFKTVVQERWEEITINGEPITKENVIEKFNEIANTNEGGAKINAGTNITLQPESDGSITISATGELGGTVAWADVTDKPSTFTPSAHNHVVADITDLQGKLDEKANVSDIPSLDGYATEEWVNSQGYLTEHQDISQLATKAELATKQDTLVSGESIKTINGQTLLGEGNIEIQGGGSGISDAPSDDKLYGRKNANWSEIIIPSTDNFATKSEIADMLTKTEAASAYQPKGDYLTAVPDEYVTETELNGKGYATTSQLDSKLDTETYNSDKATFATKEELAGKANTSDLSNYLQTSVAESTYAKKSEIPEAYSLPIATAEALGGIKVGAGLSINPGTGVLSATGGGTADSVDWANITSKPETFKPEAHQHVTADVTDLQDKLDAKADTTAIADMATKTWVGEQGFLTEHQDISQLATKQEVTEGLAAKQDKGNYLTVENAQSTYQPIGDYATKAELANKVDVSAYTEDKATFALKSELTNFITASVDNLVNYYKKSETYTKGEVDGKISAITTINFEVVGELPGSGEANKIYLVPNAEQGEQNVKDEYIWVDGKWEIIGSTKVDLSNYYNKGEVDSKLSAKVDLSTYSSDKETFALKSEISDMATQTWVTSQGYLTSHQDISNLATKQEVTEGLASKQDKGDYALKSELPDISNLATKEELSSKANTSDLSNYVTTVNAEATYAKKSEIPSLEGYLQTSKADEKYATKAELEGKVDDADIADMLTKTEASEKYQPIGSYLTEVPAEYITESELDAKGYKKIEYLTQTQYDELPTKEEGVLYVITDATEVVIPDTSDMLTKTEASSTYQPKGEYATTSQLDAKQDTLVSGTNIKTINGQTLLGSGDIVIEGGSSSGNDVQEVSGITNVSVGSVKENRIYIDTNTIEDVPSTYAGEVAAPIAYGNIYLGNNGKLLKVYDKDTLTKTEASSTYKTIASEWYGTQSEYDGITEKDPNVTYYITEG